MFLIRRLVPSHVRRAVRDALRPTPTKTAERQRGDRSSFGTVIDERLVWLHEHVPPAIAEFQADIYTKDGQRRLGQRLGLAMPELHLTQVPLAEALSFVAERGLERFVIKPVLSSNGVGCRALVAEGRGFRDLRSGRLCSLAAHGRVMASEYGCPECTDAWLVEELMLPADGTLRAVDDYKFYCVGARVELILATHPQRRGRRTKQFHDRDWQPVNVGLDDRATFSYEAPLHGGKLVEFAEAAASRFAYPFIRIDAFDTTRGIVLGEFTPGPGRRHRFNDHWNDYLLRRWREAEARLIDGIRSGTVDLIGPTAKGDGPNAIDC